MTAVTGNFEPPRPIDDVPARHAALVEAAARIRAGGRRVPVEQILLLAASVLFPLGLVLIMLGWYGAAHNGRTYAQISYLISGGIFGLGLSVAGGFMYFGYWLSRQLGESRRQHGLTLQALGRLEDLLDAAVNGGVSQPAVPPDPGTPGRRAATSNGLVPAGGPGRRSGRPAAADTTGEVPVPAGSSLVATPRGSLLHRPTCPVVARRRDLRTVPPGTGGFGYCTMCDAEAVVV